MAAGVGQDTTSKNAVSVRNTRRFEPRRLRKSLPACLHTEQLTEPVPCSNRHCSVGGPLGTYGVRGRAEAAMAQLHDPYMLRYDSLPCHRDQEYWKGVVVVGRVFRSSQTTDSSSGDEAWSDVLLNRVHIGVKRLNMHFSCSHHTCGQRCEESRSGGEQFSPTALSPCVRRTSGTTIVDGAEASG